MTVRKCAVLGCGLPREMTGVPVNQIGKANRVATCEISGNPNMPAFPCCDACAPEFIALKLSCRPIKGIQ
jgi:hypothetical protein